MAKVLIVGNGVFGLAVYGFWLVIGGDKAIFLPGFILGTLLFFGGIAVGVIASTQQSKKKSRRQRKVVRQATANFEIVDD